MSRSSRALLAIAIAAPLGCDPAAPPAPASSAAPTASAAAAPAPTTGASAAIRTPAPTTGASVAPPSGPAADGGVAPARICEVEIGGTVKAPRKLDGAAAPQTFVAVGDCLGDGKVVGNGGTTNGRFFIEVFVPWGSDLTLCAASVPAPGKPSTLYGKAKIPMHAEKTGEVEFRGVVVDLAPGPARTFSPPVR